MVWKGRCEHMNSQGKPANYKSPPEGLPNTVGGIPQGQGMHQCLQGVGTRLTEGPHGVGDGPETAQLQLVISLALTCPPDCNNHLIHQQNAAHITHRLKLLVMSLSHQSRLSALNPI
jgi:hypothetical protein